MWGLGFSMFYDLFYGFLQQRVHFTSVIQIQIQSALFICGDFIQTHEWIWSNSTYVKSSILCCSDLSQSHTWPSRGCARSMAHSMGLPASSEVNWKLFLVHICDFCLHLEHVDVIRRHGCEPEMAFRHIPEAFLGGGEAQGVGYRLPAPQNTSQISGPCEWLCLLEIL